MVLTKFQLSEFPFGFTEPTLALRGLTLPRQVSALFRPRPGRTRQLCRPLHSAAANNGGALSLRSDGRKLTRPASDRAHPDKQHKPEVARLRPTSNKPVLKRKQYHNQTSSLDCAGRSLALPPANVR